MMKFTQRNQRGAKRFVSAVTLSLALLALPVTAAEDSAQEKLADLLSGYENFSAEFEQITRTEQSRAAEIYKGSVQVARPNKFRWETRIPYPQTIISDGEYIWLYDPDLEQATRKPANDTQANPAALILNGDIKGLATAFNIKLVLAQEGKQRFDLTPKDPQSNFQSIRVFFNQGVMAELVLQDMLGQKTTIFLNNPQLNLALDDKTEAELFSFDAPEGTDIILSGSES